MHPPGPVLEVRQLHLYESTRIIDGDLRPILSLPQLQELRLASRRHYSPQVVKSNGSWDSSISKNAHREENDRPDLGLNRIPIDSDLTPIGASS